MSHITKLESKFDKDLVMNRILTDDAYFITETETYKHFNIDDRVVCFYNGNNWNIILLDDMLAYPILYFTYWSEKNNTTYNNSLVVCPITLRTMIYKGRIQIISIINDRLYLLNMDTEDEFFMDMPYTGSYDAEGKEKRIKSHVKRHEVKLLTLREVFMIITDPKYIVIKEKYKQRPIIYERYYNNKLTHNGYSIHTTFHPKTIVYVIQYFSHNMNMYRYNIIVGRDINKETVTGYSYRNSGIWDYFKKHLSLFVKKKAYIYPVFWFMVDKLYPQATIITLF